MEDQFRLQLIAPEDLPQVTQVHIRAFRASALTALGGEAVRRYYEWQLLGPHDHRFVGAWSAQGELAGFCVGGISRSALGGFLARNRKWLTLRVAMRPWLLANPVVLRQARRALEVLGVVPAEVRAKAPGIMRPERSYGILSIAVDPVYQGKGVAQALMEDAEREARARGFHHMHLTVATDNVRAIRFYEKTGWRKVPEGEDWAGYMEKHLRPLDGRGGASGA